MADSLTFDPNNANKGTARGRGMLERSLQQYGAGRAPVASADGVILAGNKTIEVARELGIPVQEIESDGKTLFVIRRTDLPYDDPRAKELAIADNRSGEVSLEWNAEALTALQDDGIDLGQFWFPEELAELLAMGDDGTEGLTDPDDVPGVPDEPITKPGDLWLMGEHRLLCGDSTVVTDVDRLMDGRKADMVFTDPPYGIDVLRSSIGGSKPFGTADSGGSNIIKANQYAPIVGDSTTETARDIYNLCVGYGMTNIVMWSGNYFTDFLPPSRCWIVWDKKGRDWDDNFSDFEMAWTTFGKPSKIFRHTWMGIVQSGKRETRVHPTQKPAALAGAILDYFDAGSLVLDLFGGSGSTLIACEETDRTAYLCEISPAYCDVIVRRWEEFTGQTASREQVEG